MMLFSCSHKKKKKKKTQILNHQTNTTIFFSYGTTLYIQFNLKRFVYFFIWMGEKNNFSISLLLYWGVPRGTCIIISYCFLYLSFLLTHFFHSQHNSRVHSILHKRTQTKTQIILSRGNEKDGRISGFSWWFA